MTTPMGTEASTANKVVNADVVDLDKVGVFTTAQSGITFPGATAAVTTIWKVLGNVSPGLGETNRTVPVVLALIIGLVIFVTSVTKGSGWKQRIPGLLIAFFNSATIAAAALGIEGASQE
jgi:hypothetical protein